MILTAPVCALCAGDADTCDCAVRCDMCRTYVRRDEATWRDGYLQPHHVCPLCLKAGC